MTTPITFFETHRFARHVEPAFAQMLRYASRYLCLLGLACLAFSEIASAQSPPSFDHDFTRFPLTGKHARVTCESCHVDGVFQGTPTQCQRCHGGLGDRTETRRSTTHVPIQSDCNDCHTTRFWEPARMDHGRVGENCHSCHEGRMAPGKNSSHMQSSSQCGDCHGTRRWEGARFDHDTITANCANCHNGSVAPGKNVGHVQSSNDCELCHSTRAWTPAGFDHLTVAPGTCNSCHNGNIATGTPSGHFVSTLSCDSCHNTRNWDATNFDHAGTMYSGDHGVRLDCNDCHVGNTQVVAWDSPAYQPDCAGCHARDFRVGGPHRNGTVSELRDCAGACHRSSEHSVRAREW